LDVRWPLAGVLGDGLQRFTPRLQFAATSPVDNVDVPNEDARAFELADSNIFALNRFPGADRFEDGARLTYGFDYSFNQPGLSVETTIAQSYRFGDRASIFPDGTGLTDNTSDIVGRSTVAWRSSLRLTHRFRLDKDNFAVRRNEIDATIGSRQTYAIIGYSRLNRNIANIGEDLRDREELRLGGRVQIGQYWSVFGSTILDLTDAAEDPTSTADGFEPVRHRLGIAYEDDCLTLGFTWRRDYQDNGDARRGNSFQLRLVLRNLGV
jgi:LPS-assembly protein